METVKTVYTDARNNAERYRDASIHCEDPAVALRLINKSFRWRAVEDKANQILGRYKPSKGWEAEEREAWREFMDCQDDGHSDILLAYWRLADCANKGRYS